MQLNPIDYTSAEKQRPPRRRWLPFVLLCVSAAVWYRPRLTPTFYPDLFDQVMLALLLIGAFMVGYWCRLPGWALLAFGGFGVCLFLLANFNDNNFRANTRAADILVPWSLYVAGGAFATRVAASLGAWAKFKSNKLEQPRL